MIHVLYAKLKDANNARGVGIELIKAYKKAVETSSSSR
jgi:hypothetical protein